MWLLGCSACLSRELQHGSCKVFWVISRVVASAQYILQEPFCDCQEIRCFYGVLGSCQGELGGCLGFARWLLGWQVLQWFRSYQGNARWLLGCSRYNSYQEVVMCLLGSYGQFQGNRFVVTKVFRMIAMGLLECSKQLSMCTGWLLGLW